MQTRRDWEIFTQPPCHRLEGSAWSNSLLNQCTPRYNYTNLIDLAQAMQDAEGMVRGYAAWGLGRIGGSQVRQILETNQRRETDEFAIKEIQAALEVA